MNQIINIMKEEMKLKKNNHSEKLSLGTMLAFALGGFGNSLMSGIVYTSVSFFYTDKLFADAKMIGWAWIIFMVWNTINDPIFGYITDNTRNKLGRRIPYIRYGAIFYGLLFIFCWYPIAPIGSKWGLFFNFIIILFLFDTMYSIIGTCYYCLPNEMTTDPVQRARLSFFGTFFWIGSIIVQMVVPMIFLTQGTSDLHPMFRTIMIIFALISTLLMFGTSYFLKENKFAQIQEHENFIKSYLDVLKNKPFLIYELSNFSLTLVTTTLTTGIFYYINDVLEIDLMALFTQEVVRWDLSIGALLMLIGLFIGSIIAVFKVKKWGVKKIYLISFSAITIGFFLFTLTGLNAITNAYPTSISWLLLSLGAAGAMIIMPVVTGDVIDNDELITGKRREGVYGGFNAIITKPAISIANAIFLWVIDDFGYVANPPSGHQTDFAKLGILIAFTLIPAIFTLITTIVMKWYSLDGPEWKRKKEEIKILHEKKNTEYHKWLETQKQNKIENLDSHSD